VIYKDSKVTPWEDTPVSLVRAAHDAAFSKQEIEVVRSDRWGEIRHTTEGWYTRSRMIIEAALAEGWWVEPSVYGPGWIILFDWPRDPNNRPNNRAIHAAYLVEGR